MKQTLKYVKTRGQKSILEQNQIPLVTELDQTIIKKKSTESSLKEQTDIKNLPKTKQKASPKTKIITKITSPKIKQKALKLKKQQIVAKIKPKKQSINHVNNVNGLTKQVQKNNGMKPKLKKKKINIQQRKFNKQQKNQKTQSKTPSQKINNNIENQPSLNNIPVPKINKLSLIKGQGKKQKKQQSGSKIKLQNQHKSPSKGAKLKIPKQKNNQSQTNALILQQNQVSSITNIISEPQVQVKKKGRPKKIVAELKKEPRSTDEQKQLDEFIENAIRLRKVKNEKQFFECFSRIAQYVRQSFEYGDLGKQLKSIPRNQDILNIGIPIVRGIRKQIQQQQFLNLTV